MDDKKPGKPKRVGKGDGKGRFSTVQDVNENELTDIKKKQDSINRLNENRLININKELMKRLLK